MAKIKTGPKLLLAVLVIGGGLFGVRWYQQNHGKAKMESSVPQAGELVDFKEATPQKPEAVGAIALPSSSPASVSSPKIRVLTLPWNATAGFALANGGPVTTTGSLMEKYGVNLVIERKDDYGEMQNALSTCAEEVMKGKKVCVTGANFVIIMGDGGPAFLAGLNERLKKVGKEKEYIGEVVAAFGRSFGEDQFMVPPEVAADPQKLRGLLVGAVLKDGDWNLALFLAAANGICNNPDVTTYDPDCLNWVGTDSFVDADNKYIQGYCENRPVVSKGKKTGKMASQITGDKCGVTMKAVCTWTPGDVAVTKEKGGLVTAISTRDNASQMASTIIGIKKWNASNSEVVENMIRAGLEAGNQIKVGGQKVLLRAGDAMAKINKEQTAAWWAKYYRGVEEMDKTETNSVKLGGSRVFNLADALLYFGITEGSANAYEATYVTFGNIAHAQYPKDLPSYPPISEILNLTYLRAVAAKGVDQGKADAPKFDDSVAATETMAKRSWNITFATGKATFTKEAASILAELFNQLTVSDNTLVEIHGHTDNVGSEDGNMKLSNDRADAVRAYLESKSKSTFPAHRVSVKAHGQNEPVAPNTTSEGRAKNRRVEIIIKRNG